MLNNFLLHKDIHVEWFEPPHTRHVRGSKVIRILFAGGKGGREDKVLIAYKYYLLRNGGNATI